MVGVSSYPVIWLILNKSLFNSFLLENFSSNLGKSAPPNINHPPQPHFEGYQKMKIG